MLAARPGPALFTLATRSSYLVWGLRPDSLVEVRPAGRVVFSHQALHHCTRLQEHSRVFYQTTQCTTSVSVYLACSPPAAQLLLQLPYLPCTVICVLIQV